MNKPEKPNPNFFSKIATNLSWIFALLFPKKSKPPAKPVAKPAATPPPAPTAAPVASASPTTPKPPAKEKTASPIFQPGKLLPAFWTVASGLSVIVNVILIVVIIILVQQLFNLKRLVGQELIGGLYTNFILMDQAHIQSNIVVEDTIPVQFDLPISQQITVTLTSDTVIRGALVGVLSGPTTVTLPAGTRLPIQLDLTVPVNTTIPIKINVPVDIPLQETELHRPFIGLQGVLSPYYWMLQPGIKNASDLEACKAVSWFCDMIFAK